ncbi:MAG: hypothetical protein KF752_15815 [Pirellulaceae bacterium]|nr:hypothetical protein [Pirellulaceae bacterium]
MASRLLLSSFIRQRDYRAMRNRIVSSIDGAGFDLVHQVSGTSCAIQSDYVLTEHQLALFGPERYEPRYEYPLLVWLHSCHSSEGELEGVMPALSLQNYVGCAPRGPISSDRGSGRFVWGKSPTATGVAEEIVFESLGVAAEQFSINRRRIFLAGFGSGGTMALRIGLRYAHLFAGVVAVGCKFPNEQCALSNLPQARTLPILWLYGEHSTQCSVSHICESLPVLHAAGLALDIRQYPCGDELLSNMLSDTNLWLMQHVTNQPMARSDEQAATFSRN